MTYPAPQSPYPPQQPVAPGPRNHGLAVAGMVVSLASIVMCWVSLVAAPVGAVLSHVGLSKIRNEPHRYAGAGMALTGIIVGWVVFAGWVLLLVFVILAGTGYLGPELYRELNS